MTSTSFAEQSATSRALPPGVLRMLTCDPRRAIKKLPPATPLLDRVLLRSSPSDGGCWIFGGALTRGYGMVRRRPDGSHYAHRVTYEALVGPVRPWLWLDHTCRTPACCNPEHLEAVTPGENTARGYWANGHPRATHCSHGHVYAQVGTYARTDGTRRCRRCMVAESSRQR